MLALHSLHPVMCRTASSDLNSLNSLIRLKQSLQLQEVHSLITTGTFYFLILTIPTQIFSVFLIAEYFIDIYSFIFILFLFFTSFNK